jgi:hypothetical protein
LLDDLKKTTEHHAIEPGSVIPLPGSRRRVGLLGRCAIGTGLLLLAALAVAGFSLWQIQSERNSAFLREKFLALIGSGLGPDNRLILAEAGLSLAGIAPTFSIGGLSIRNPGTGATAELERADVRLTRMSMFRLAPEAKTIRFDGLKLVLPSMQASGDPLSANEALTLIRAALASVHFTISGQDPVFASITAIEGRNISIFRREADRDVLVRDGLTAALRRRGETELVASIGREGEAADITLSARSRATGEGLRAVELQSGSVPAGILFELLGLAPSGVDPGLRVETRLVSRVDRDNRTHDTVLSLRAGGGVITPTDPDMMPFHLDEAALDLRFDPQSPTVAIDQLAVRFNEAEIIARGSLSPREESGAGIGLALKAERFVLGRLSPADPVVRLDHAELEGVIAPDLATLDVSRLEFGAAGGSGRMRGRFSNADGGAVETWLDVGGFDLRTALRIWPVWIAPNIRNWLIDHAPSGRLADLSVHSRLQGETLLAAQQKRPIPDDALKLTYRMDGLTLKPLKDALPVQGMTVEGISSGRRAAMSVQSGRVETAPGQAIEFRDAEFRVANTAERPAVLEMNIPLKGQLAALTTFLAAPSLKSVAGLPSDLKVQAGTVEGRANVRLPLKAEGAAKDTRVDFRADLRQVAIDNLVKDERLEDGTFAVQSRAGQVLLKGEAKFLGTQSQIELKSEPGKPPRALLKASLDEALLAKRGMDLRPHVSGPIALTVGVDLDSRPQPVFEIDLDLVRTRIESPIPGLAKRPSQPGRAKFTVTTRADTTIIEDLDSEIGAFSAKGRFEIQKGQINRAEFSALKLSPGDNVKLTFEKARVPKVVIRGNSFDLRPFLKSMQGGRIEEAKTPDGKPAPAPAPDFDLDLETTVLVGFNGELISAANAKAQRRQGRLAQLQLDGRFGAAPIAIATTAQRQDASVIAVSTEDAGAMFRFLDLYTRARGGRLNGEITIAANRQSGLIQVRDFTVRGEPAFRQASGPIASSQPDRQTPAGGDTVQFEKFRAEFARSPGRLDIQEVVIWGASTGGTLEGTIDYARDRVSLKGAFVPAYALNNLFAQMPIIGRLLGGGQYEGLFAVPFVITGLASQPVLRINPVSAIAPGFLRKFFEIQREP